MAVQFIPSPQQQQNPFLNLLTQMMFMKMQQNFQVQQQEQAQKFQEIQLKSQEQRFQQTKELQEAQIKMGLAQEFQPEPPGGKGEMGEVPSPDFVWEGKSYYQKPPQILDVGGQRFLIRGNKIVAAPRGLEPKYDIFENEKTGEQKYVLKGTPVEQGWKVVRPATTQINIGEPGPGIEKSTKGAIEKEIIAGQDLVAGLKSIGESFVPKYLTYEGAAKQWGFKQIEKFGGKLKSEEKEFLAGRQEWMQRAQAEFLKWRKYITGVAGGEKEMQEIAKSWPDPTKDSPTTFMANLNSALVGSFKAINRRQEYLKTGVKRPIMEMELTNDQWNQVNEIMRGFSIGESPVQKYSTAEEYKRAKGIGQ